MSRKKSTPTKIGFSAASGKRWSPHDHSGKTRRTDPSERVDDRLHVVGIGASAGGLAACTKFLDHIPTNSGMAFVLSLHLELTSANLLLKLLSPQNRVRVCDASEDQILESDCVYVIPSHQHVSFSNGRLQLAESEQCEESGKPIDFFFRALALEKGPRAIAIILSGRDTHGTSGLRDIKQAGGIVLAQQPETADYDQMPCSAIATGLVDLVLPPEQMPKALADYCRLVYRKPKLRAFQRASCNKQLDRLLAELHERTQCDFRSFREEALLRRVQRRMGLHDFEKISDYCNHFNSNPAEASRLSADLLIDVTGCRPEPAANPVLESLSIPVVEVQRGSVAELKQLNASLEQRVAEKTQQVELLAEALSNLAEGVLITSNQLEWPDARIIYVNDALCRITGYSAEELIGQTPAKLQQENSEPEVVQRLREDLSVGRSHLCEMVNCRKDGTPYHVELLVTPLLDSHGNSKGFIAIHRDISDRIRTQVELKASEALIRGILDSLVARIAVVDGQGTIIMVNPAWEEFSRKNYGSPRRCNVGANYLDVCRQAAAANVQEASQVATALQAILDGESQQFTCEYSCDSATERRWYLLHITPLRRQHGAVISHVDITTRVLAELRLRDREERLSVILNTAADAIVTMDRNGIIDDANWSTQRMFGYMPDEVVGQSINLLIPRLSHLAQASNLANSGEKIDLRKFRVERDSVGRRKDGSTFPVGLVVNQASDRELFTGFIRDNSDRRELQMQILEIAAEEDRRIAYELHDNVQQQLTGLGLLAQSQAAALAKELSPLTPQVARIAQGIAEVANQVHLLSHGLMPVEIEADELHAALTRFAATVSEQCGVECVFQSSGPIEINQNFTATHLFRIAQEAVNNAIKYSQARRIQIVLSGNRNELALQIEDNGIGIGEPNELSAGMGLRNMNYRASMMGATLDVAPIQSGGTLVICRLSMTEWDR